MVNYYEILELDFSASRDVIEARLDEQYVKWRALVTHHDSEIASQATKAIQTIEQARNVLTDPAKKQTYDRDLQAELATMGGLVDPSVVGQESMRQPGFGMAMPRRPIMGRQQQPQVERLDAWICSKCQRPNPKGTTFCVKCGAVVGVNCPSCGVLGDYSDKFCSECGRDKKEAFEDNKAMRLKELKESITEIEKDIHFAKSEPRKFAKINCGPRKNFGGLSFISGIIFIVGLILRNAGQETLGIVFILVSVVIGVVRIIARINDTKTKVSNEIVVMEGQIQERKTQINQVQQEKY